MYEFNKKFDVIFSLANHSTFDLGIKSTNNYLYKCDALLKKGGHFLIESHHPSYEKISEFSKIVENFKKDFNYNVENSSILKTNFFYDDGRKFYLLKKN